MDTMNINTVTAKGRNGTVSFDGKSITIERSGFLARSTVGKGRKRLALRHISSVQVKPASVMMNGFIEFTIAGGNENRSRFGGQTKDAAHNENAVIFTKKQQSDFETLRDAVEDAIVEL